MQKYGGQDDRRQEDVQNDLVRLLDAAARTAGLDNRTWYRQGVGDSSLSLIPLDGTEPRVVDDYLRHLDHELDRYNQYRSAPARLRLRVAVHEGVAYPAANGFAGAGVVVVSRLLDSDAVRTALTAAPTANLALIVSDAVYRDLIRNGHTTYRDDEFREVAVEQKELSTTAWVRVPGYDVSRLPLNGAAPAAAHRTVTRASTGAHGTVNQAGGDIVIDQQAPARPAPTAEYNFHGPVDGRYATFGPVNGDPHRDG